MRLLILKLVSFLVAVTLWVAVTIYVFRTEMPFLWIVCLFLLFILLLFFPYSKVFKLKEKTNEK